MMTSTQVKFKVNRAGSSSLNLQDLLLNLLLAGPEAEAGDNQFLNLHAPPCCICMFESFLLLREPHLFKNSFCCSIESSFCKDYLLQVNSKARMQLNSQQIMHGL
ncbi:uncharacterized protein LOC126624988 isoform X2 [Malus sylvestris]|uniref:uncharacterized protein LOC126624988 isoform X2 n=1 Tax=Malus sylvestris TaxID=3752 RepID=UPI0021AC3483|nr:uncharacterized protein LOC126624988 isoform X2 [Malus sylvestris]